MLLLLNIIMLSYSSFCQHMLWALPPRIMWASMIPQAVMVKSFVITLPFLVNLCVCLSVCLFVHLAVSVWVYVYHTHLHVLVSINLECFKLELTHKWQLDVCHLQVHTCSEHSKCLQAFIQKGYFEHSHVNVNLHLSSTVHI